MDANYIIILNNNLFISINIQDGLLIEKCIEACTCLRYNVKFAQLQYP